MRLTMNLALHALRGLEHLQHIDLARDQNVAFQSDKVPFSVCCPWGHKIIIKKILLTIIIARLVVVELIII